MSNKNKNILGLELDFEVQIDAPKSTKWVKAFVAAYDPDKGLTIKALDPEDCPDWTNREKDGSVNLGCADCKNSGHKKIFPDYIAQIKTGKLPNNYDIGLLRKFGYLSTGSQQVCIFS